MAYPVNINRLETVEMDDGAVISLTTYLPDAAGDGPFPAVLESVPYRKDDDCTARDWETFGYLASQGIAGVRLDIRGTGNSTGIIVDEYVAREQADALEVLRWMAGQDWCTGRLGMWGISWGGFSALQTAMLRPEELVAIAPMHATHDRFACDVHYLGGSLHLQEQVDWPTSMVPCNAMPPDPEIFGDEWFDEWIRRLEGTPQWPFEWLRHQRRNDYWLHGSPIADYASIECPTLLIGGWLDGYVDGMLALAEHLSCETRTVVGPWGHSRPASGYPAPTMDHFDLLARWFGHHLRGDDNGVMDMPAVSMFVQAARSATASAVWSMCLSVAPSRSATARTRRSPRTPWPSGYGRCRIPRPGLRGFPRVGPTPASSWERPVSDSPSSVWQTVLGTGRSCCPSRSSTDWEIRR